MKGKQSSSVIAATQQQNRNMQHYYRLQSKIYDATRWSFLFGRRRLLRALPFDRTAALQVVEVGCGTGFNLRRLARRYPAARITGMDVSADMIRIARRRTSPCNERVQLVQAPYQEGAIPNNTVDLMLFSYSLTMINPQWRSLIELSAQNLRSGGVVAVVDFHNSPFSWFKKHMATHHVRMDGHLLPELKRSYQPLVEEVRPAYGGLWHYLCFIGQK